MLDFRRRVKVMVAPAALMVLFGCAAPGGSLATDSSLGGSARVAPPASYTFDRVALGTMPPDWSIRETQPTTKPAIWQVVTDATAPSRSNVLALTATDNYNGTFNLAIADRTNYSDLDLSVRVKAVSGVEDQGGGPIWRCRDANNYYISRFNPLEDNFRVYKVVDGKRKRLDTARIKTVAGRWYTVRVVMVGDRITCYLDGARLLRAQDDSFTEAGMIGLWTKADAVTSFDDLSIEVR